MKKHILRTLVVMLMACLGVGILAACGGDPKEDPIEGVWSGATGVAASSTITLDLDGDTAHVVMKQTIEETTRYQYFAFSKAADGTYTHTEGSGNNAYTATIKLNSENKLEWTSTSPASEGDSESLTTVFPTKAALPSSINVTGTKYAVVGTSVAELNFGSTPAVKVGDSALTDVKLFNVGGFKVFTGKSGQSPESVIVYQEQSKLYAYLGAAVELVDTAPAAADPIEGVWSGSTNTEMASAIFTIDVEGNTAHVVAKQLVDTEVGYAYFAFSKASDGSYTMTLGEGAEASTISLKVNAENELEYTSAPSASAPSGTPSRTATFPDKANLSSALNITGTQYTRYMGGVAEFTFGTTPTITYDGDALTDVSVINVGDYKVVKGEHATYGVVTVIVYRDGSTYKGYIALESDGPGEGETIVFQNTPFPTSFTVEFDLGDQPAAVVGATQPASVEDKEEGDTVSLPTADTIHPASDWELEGWYRKNGTKVSGASYEVDVDDATGDTITLTAKWKYHKTLNQQINQTAWTAYTPTWTDTDALTPGRVFTYSGTIQSTIADQSEIANFQAPIVYLYTGNAPTEFIRTDNFVGWANSDWWSVQDPDEANGTHAMEGGVIREGGTSPLYDADYKAMLKDGKITISFDWSIVNRIYIIIALSSNDGTKTQRQVYLFTGSNGNLIEHEEYKVGFGGEAVNYTFTEKTDTSLIPAVQVSADQTHVEVGSDALDLGFTGVNPCWIGAPISAGDKVEINGTLKLNNMDAGNPAEDIPPAARDYFVPILNVISANSYGGFIRMDGWVNYFEAEGWYETERTAEFNSLVGTQGTVKITFDWSDAAHLVLSIEFTPTGGQAKTTSITFSKIAGATVAEQLYIGIGGEHIHLTGTVTRTHTAPAD